MVGGTSFDMNRLKEKFSKLNSTQDSVQTLSLWIIHHKANSDKIVELWLKTLKQSTEKHKLNLMYLANDVIQNCRKRNAKMYIQLYRRALTEAIYFIKDEQIKTKVIRILSILKDRKFYDPQFIDHLIESIESNKCSTNGYSTKNVLDIPKPTKNHKNNNKNNDKIVESTPFIASQYFTNCQDLVTNDSRITFAQNDIVTRLEQQKLLTINLDENITVDEWYNRLILSGQISNFEWIQQCKDKESATQHYKDLEMVCIKLEAFIEQLRCCVRTRKRHLENSHCAKNHYKTLLKDAKFVINAYEKYTTRIQSVQAKLSSTLTTTNNNLNKNDHSEQTLSNIARKINDKNRNYEHNGNTSLNPTNQNNNIIIESISKIVAEMETKISNDTDMRLTGITNKNNTQSFQLPGKGAIDNVDFDMRTSYKEVDIPGLAINEFETSLLTTNNYAFGDVDLRKSLVPNTELTTADMDIVNLEDEYEYNAAPTHNRVITGKASPHDEEKPLPPADPNPAEFLLMAPPPPPPPLFTAMLSPDSQKHMFLAPKQEQLIDKMPPITNNIISQSTLDFDNVEKNKDIGDENVISIVSSSKNWLEQKDDTNTLATFPGKKRGPLLDYKELPQMNIGVSTSAPPTIYHTPLSNQLDRGAMKPPFPSANKSEFLVRPPPAFPLLTNPAEVSSDTNDEIIGNIFSPYSVPPMKTTYKPSDINATPALPRRQDNHYLPYNGATIHNNDTVEKRLSSFNYEINNTFATKNPVISTQSSLLSLPRPSNTNNIVLLGNNEQPTSIASTKPLDILTNLIGLGKRQNVSTSQSNVFSGGLSAAPFGGNTSVNRNNLKFL